MAENGGYAKPEALVTTDWVAEHADDPGVVIAEVNEDPSLYEDGHVPGATALHWKDELQQQVVRDVIDQRSFEQLLGSKGIRNGDTVVLYGDKNNWFAAYAYWYLKIYGHDDVRMMDGGRQKWIDEDRPFTTGVDAPPTVYGSTRLDRSIRALRDDILAILDSQSHLVDVRSPQEYSGELMAPPGYEQEGASRTGHIPRAQSIPWAQAVRDDGTFKSAEELHALYRAKGVDGSKPITAYCRIGERSSHTWFVLRELLGYENVRNYDGSWTEWGNLTVRSRRSACRSRSSRSRGATRRCRRTSRRARRSRSTRAARASALRTEPVSPCPISHAEVGLLPAGTGERVPMAPLPFAAMVDRAAVRRGLSNSLLAFLDESPLERDSVLAAVLASPGRSRRGAGARPRRRRRPLPRAVRARLLLDGRLGATARTRAPPGADVAASVDDAPVRERHVRRRAIHAGARARPRRSRRLARPTACPARGGGSLLVTVPFVWEEHERPFDFYRYSSTGLSHTLEAAGFADISVRPRNRLLLDPRAAHAERRLGHGAGTGRARSAARGCRRGAPEAWLDRSPRLRRSTPSTSFRSAGTPLRGEGESRGRKPTVLYLAPWVDLGGSDRNTVDLVRWLDRDRFRVIVATTQEVGTAGSPRSQLRRRGVAAPRRSFPAAGFRRCSQTSS